MGAPTAEVIERLRRPEYTGENRCVPCTAVNVAIALVGSVLLWFVWEPLGVGLLAVGLASIYLRGYLVPGTPTLTRRYFPEPVLRLFDKAPAAESADAPLAGTEGDLDPEPVLLEAGVVEPCRGGEDLCATEGFADAWYDEMARLRAGGLEERMAELLGADPGEVEVVVRETWAHVRRGGQVVARWESEAAMLADAAAVPELRRRLDGWAGLDPRARGTLLHGARVFLERCPACDGPVSFSEDTIESCCRAVEVVALTCDDCESLLLEVEV